MALRAADTRLDMIDALRGIAALMVVIYHARAEFWVGVSNSWAANGLTTNPAILAGYASYPFSYGWFGVQIFFVLSGYCIHRRLALELKETGAPQIDWRRFFIRRFVRIYPVYIGALFCTGLVDYLYMANGGDIAVGEPSVSAFIASIFTLQGIFGPMFGSNTVFWTLSIEIHLYLFYPLIFAMNRRNGAAAALLSSFIVSAAYVAAYLFFDLGRLFPYGHGGGPIFLPFVFMWAAGAYLADIEAGRAPELAGPLWMIGWIAGLIGGFMLHMITDEVVSAIPLAIGAAGLVSWLKSVGKTWPHLSRRVLPPLVWLGAISYSLYATHRVTFGMINAAGLDGQAGSIAKFIFATMAAIGFAYLFYILVERASLNVSAGLRGSRLGPAMPDAQK